jgi:AraC family transcriptional regulator, transcriptional activator of pobA
MSVNTPILSLSSSVTGIPFEIHTIEWIEQNRWQQNASPHRHNYFVIVWIKKGEGTHLVDLVEYPLERDTIYCITPGQVHHLTPDGPAEGYVISFTPDFMGPSGNVDLLFDSGLFYAFSHSPVIKVTEDIKNDLEDMAGRMMREYANFFLLRGEILRGFLQIFLVYLTRQFNTIEKNETPPKSVELAKKFIALLEKNYAQKRMVSEYADELIVTPNHLNEVVKKVTGFPASHHIQQRIILEAKRQGAYSSATMKEIAYQLGFDDVAHFSKFFKTGAGESFTEFRKGLSKAFSNETKT